MQATTLDFESHLIQPGVQVPKPVCLAIDGPRGDRLIHCKFDARDARDSIYEAIARGDMMVGANLPIDLAMALAEWPELADAIWHAMDTFKVWDVLQAEKLINLAQGKLRFEYDEDGDASAVEYSLAGVVDRRFGVKLEKDEFRLIYGTMYDLPIRLWKPGAVKYPLDDMGWTRGLFREQIKAPPEWLVDVGRQTRHAWWMYLMSARGFALSKERTLRLEADLQAEMRRLLEGDKSPFKYGPDGSIVVTREEDKVGLLDAGLVDKTGKREEKIAGLRLKRLNDERGLVTPTTATGKIQLTKESCKAVNDRLLKDYSRFTELKVTLGKAQALKSAVMAGMPIQSRFEVILESGRTSCSGGKPKTKSLAGANRMSFGFQIQNVKKEPGLRECFTPRPGYYLGSLDYGQLESCTWAQVCLDLFGFSKMAEMLNADVDVHSKLGAMLFGLEYEWVIANKKTDEKAKGARNCAKPFVFGKPGGMGDRGVQAFANAPPYNLTLTIEEAKKYGNTWAKLFPESKPFFEFVHRCVSRDRVIRQVRSNRLRGGCGFTDGCNTLFQGLAADVAKAAMYECTRACHTGRDSQGNRYPALHGSYLVNFVHDEGIFEFPIDRAHEAAYEATSIMNRVSQEWMPGCPSKVEPCLMLEWAKDAATKHDENGRLIPWVKKVAE